MFQPLGFEQKSVLTSLGRMVYYTNSGVPWSDFAQAETLVFLHGFGGGSSAYEWSKIYPAFASEYKIIAPDLIGWGESEHIERNYQIEDYLTTIGEFLTQISSIPVNTAGTKVQILPANYQVYRQVVKAYPEKLPLQLTLGVNDNTVEKAQLSSD